MEHTECSRACRNSSEQGMPSLRATCRLISARSSGKLLESATRTESVNTNHQAPVDIPTSHFLSPLGSRCDEEGQA